MSQGVPIMLNTFVFGNKYDIFSQAFPYLTEDVYFALRTFEVTDQNQFPMVPKLTVSDICNKAERLKVPLVAVEVVYSVYLDRIVYCVYRYGQNRVFRTDICINNNTLPETTTDKLN